MPMQYSRERNGTQKRDKDPCIVAAVVGERHISGWSDIEQCRNQAYGPIYLSHDIYGFSLHIMYAVCIHTWD